MERSSEIGRFFNAAPFPIITFHAEKYRSKCSVLRPAEAYKD